MVRKTQYVLQKHDNLHPWTRFLCGIRSSNHYKTSGYEVMLQVAEGFLLQLGA